MLNQLVLHDLNVKSYIVGLHQKYCFNFLQKIVSFEVGHIIQKFNDLMLNEIHIYLQ